MYFVQISRSESSFFEVIGYAGPPPPEPLGRLEEPSYLNGSGWDLEREGEPPGECLDGGYSHLCGSVEARCGSRLGCVNSLSPLSPRESSKSVAVGHPKGHRAAGLG